MDEGFIIRHFGFTFVSNRNLRGILRGGRRVRKGGGTKPVRLVNSSHIPSIDNRVSVLFNWSVVLKSWSRLMNLPMKLTLSWLVFSSGVIS